MNDISLDDLIKTRADFKIGQKVSVNDPKFPGVWTVKNLGPKNATLDPVHGGRGLRAPYSLLIDPVEETLISSADGVTVTTVPFVPKIFFSEGEIVRIEEGRFAGIYVVIKDNGGDRVNVAKLGGDGGRYVRANKRGLTRIDPADVLK